MASKILATTVAIVPPTAIGYYSNYTSDDKLCFWRGPIPLSCRCAVWHTKKTPYKQHPQSNRQIQKQLEACTHNSVKTHAGIDFSALWP